MRKTLLWMTVMGLLAAVWFGVIDRAAPPRARRPAAPAPPDPVARPEPPATPLAPAPLPAPTPVAADPPPPTPHIAAGKPLSIVLSEPPARWYGRSVTDETDAHYRALVQQLSGGRAIYDPNLSRAARELVYQTTELGDIVPSDVREFVVASVGAVAADSTFQQIRTTSEGPEPLQQAIEAVVRAKAEGASPVFVGVGEVYRHGLPMPRHIGVVGTRVGVAIEAMPVRLEPGGTWTISGKLLANWTDLHALVLRADGSEAELHVTQTGERIAVSVPAGSAVGWMDVDLDGSGPLGPGKLVQLRAWVGKDPPTRFVTRAPADETALRTADDAEGFVFSLINQDRQRMDLPPLGWDRRLSLIARRHSEDMRDHGYFAHQSPTTGLPGDRLKRGGYRFVGYAENVAHNATLAEAQAGLMHSLGHRKNLLTRDLPLVGVGVAMTGQGKERRFWVTQLFAKQPTDLSAAQIEARVTELLNQRRAAAGVPALAADGPLSAAAREGAVDAARGQLDGASGRAIAVAKERDLLRGRMRAWAVVTPDIEKMLLPAETLSATASVLGVGAALEEGDGGRVSVILMIQEGLE